MYRAKTTIDFQFSAIGCIAKKRGNLVWEQTYLPQRIHFPLRFFILFNFYFHKMTGKSLCFLHHILSSLTGHLYFNYRPPLTPPQEGNVELLRSSCGAVIWNANNANARKNYTTGNGSAVKPLFLKAPLVAKHIPIPSELRRSSTFLSFGGVRGGHNLMCNKGIRERRRMYPDATEGASEDKGFAFLRAAG